MRKINVFFFYFPAFTSPVERSLEIGEIVSFCSVVSVARLDSGNGWGKLFSCFNFSRYFCHTIAWGAWNWHHCLHHRQHYRLNWKMSTTITSCFITTATIERKTKEKVVENWWKIATTEKKRKSITLTLVKMAKTGDNKRYDWFRPPGQMATVTAAAAALVSN